MQFPLRLTLHSCTVFILLAFLGILGFANADDCYAEISCGPSVQSRDTSLGSPWQSLNRKALTNAERLARGLPLLPPTARAVAARSGASPLPKVTYQGVLQVFSGSTSLGYVQTDPNYWTPMLTPNVGSAQAVQFSLNTGSTSGSQLNLQQIGQSLGPLLGLVVGRDSTTSDIGTGSFNYLYFDSMASPGTAPGATPQHVPSFFSTTSGLNKPGESSIWNVDLITGVASVQWINTDGSSPATAIFVQSNHLYAGGDVNAFHARFPAPVTPVTLKFIPI